MIKKNIALILSCIVSMLSSCQNFNVNKNIIGEWIFETNNEDDILSLSSCSSIDECYKGLDGVFDKASYHKDRADKFPIESGTRSDPYYETGYFIYRVKLEFEKHGMITMRLENKEVFIKENPVGLDLDLKYSKVTNDIVGNYQTYNVNGSLQVRLHFPDYVFLFGYKISEDNSSLSLFDSKDKDNDIFFEVSPFETDEKDIVKHYFKLTSKYIKD